MKRSIRVAMLALAMVAATVAVGPQALAAPQTTTAVVQAAPAAAPIQAADPSIQWSYDCYYTVFSGFGGGVEGDCYLVNTYMNWWVLCYNPFGAFYYYVQTGWFGPQGWWHYWAYCAGDAYPVQYGFDYIAF